MKKSEKIWSIKDMFQNIEKRPGMYLGTNEKRIDYLFHFLMGKLGYDESGLNGEFRAELTQWIYECLQKKISNKENKIEFSFLWYKMIYSITDDEEDAWNLFFEIAQDYFEQLED